jgi:hypothetical protein
MPAAAFLDACAAARKIVEHPARLIPTIIRESEPLAGQLRRRLAREEAEWANRHAPRLAAPPENPEPDDRPEIAEMMRGLIDSLSANRVTTDA